MPADTTLVPEPAADRSAWRTWKLTAAERFGNPVSGAMMLPREGRRRARLRLLEVLARHTSMQNDGHGGVIMSHIHSGLYATLRSLLSLKSARGAALDLHGQFIGAARKPSGI